MPRTLTRTEFENGLAVGWVFGVPTAFKAALDISPTSKVLSGRGGLAAELAQRGVAVPTAAMQGDAKALSELFTTICKAGLVAIDYRIEAKEGKKRIVLEIETEGNPPVYRFSIGDVFYEPRQARLVVWADALKLLRRSVRIIKVENSSITSIVCTYNNSVASSSDTVTCTPVEFVRMLHTGTMDVLDVTAPQVHAASSINAMKSVS